ncbi:hypothetical protein JCM3766R1_003301 [Sporobolomyces carnicolor]
MLQVDTAVVKPWLVQHLEPITDAEPATLAEYVLALLQRDETPEELERICTESLADFLESHTEKFVKDMLAFVRNPQSPAAAPPVAPRNKRPLEADPVDNAPAKRNPTSRPGPPQGPNGGLARGMCRDYHLRGFCARGQACPYQHDAFATAQPPPGAFPPFQFPFGGPAAMGGPGMPPLRMGFPGPHGPNGMPPPYGGPPQPGFTSPGFGGPGVNFQQQPRAGPGRNQHQKLDGGGVRGSRPPHHGHPSQQSPPPPHAFPPIDSQQQSYPYPHPSHQQQQQPNKRRAPPSHSYERPPMANRTTPGSSSSGGGPPPTPLTVLTHRFATNSSRQKELLAKLDDAAGDDKKQVMNELRKLGKEAEEILALRKKLESQASGRKMREATSALEKELNETAAGAGSDSAKGDLKAQLEKLRSEAASLGIPTDGQQPQHQQQRTAGSKRGAPPPPHHRTAQSFRLDNRSTNLIVECALGAAADDGGPAGGAFGDVDEIKRHFEQFGPVKTFSVVVNDNVRNRAAGGRGETAAAETTMVDDVDTNEIDNKGGGRGGSATAGGGGGEILVGFESRAIAEKAMSCGPPPGLATLAKLRWAPPSVATATGGTAPPAVHAKTTTTTTTNGHEASSSLSTGDVQMEVHDRLRDDGDGANSARGGGGGGGRREREEEEDDDDERSWNR